MLILPGNNILLMSVRGLLFSLDVVCGDRYTSFLH